MSLLQINDSGIRCRCFEFNNSGSLNQTTLRDLINQRKKSIALVEISLFGINHVYSLIDFSKNTLDINLLDLDNEIVDLFIAKTIEDTPVETNYNLKSNSLNFNLLNEVTWILLYQLKEIINGMNAINELELTTDIRYHLDFGSDIDIIDKYDISYLNLSPTNWMSMINDGKFKYILKFPNGEYDFSDTIYSRNIEGVFIRIPEFNCWQYLSKKKLDSLNTIDSIDIVYAITDSPRGFSKTRYHQSYSMDSLDSILKYMIYIPIDIYFKKIFDTEVRFDNEYDALEISINTEDGRISVLLTYDELGIDKTTKSNTIYYMKKFCLLKLINKLIQLKPY